MKTSEKIIKYLKEREQVTTIELVDFLNITDRAVRKQIKNLLDLDVIKKEGTPPVVFYSIKKESIKNDIKIPKKFLSVIEQNFFLIDPKGQKQEGADAFVVWCNKRDFDVNSKAEEYVKTIAKFETYKQNGLISGMYKMKKTFETVFLDEVYYLDFYSIEIFGKTKLGQMMLYAKQSQNKRLIRELVKEINPSVLKLIKDKKIDAIGFVPPTLKREVQFLREVEKNLMLSLPVIKLTKIKGEYLVPQKTLSKLEDRIENAKQIRLFTMNTVEKNSIPVYQNILLIDDALGSGATLNEIGRQIKILNLAKKVTGLAITGSFSGFEVISEI